METQTKLKKEAEAIRRRRERMLRYEEIKANKRTQIWNLKAEADKAARYRHKIEVATKIAKFLDRVKVK